MECCDVCCDKLNKTTHKKVKCPYCDLISCKSCSQRYLLTLIDDPHCMNCKKLWNREFIDSFCTIKFRNVDLKKHRENTLFERQKLLMPATQPAVERIITMRTLRTQIHDVKKQILNIQRGLGLSIHTPINPDDEIMTLPEMKILVPQLQDLQTRLSYLRNTGISPNDGEDPNRKFVRKCPSGVCKEFLDENWYCGICTTNFCDKCNAEIKDGHECDPDDVKTMKFIAKDTKPCPACGEMIQKLSGCSQMRCPQCKTAYNWTTGNIEMGRIHNPHFLEFKVSNNRDNQDIPCGGCPSFQEIWELEVEKDLGYFASFGHDHNNNTWNQNIVRFHIRFRNDVYKMAELTHLIGYFERRVTWLNAEEMDEDREFFYSRIAYMLDEMSEDMFKRQLQQTDKAICKDRDTRNIFRMFIDTSSDLLRQYVVDPTKKTYVVKTLEELRLYTNDVIKKIHRRYNHVTPHFIPEWGTSEPVMRRV